MSNFEKGDRCIHDEDGEFIIKETPETSVGDDGYYADYTCNGQYPRKPDKIHIPEAIMREMVELAE